MRPTTPWSNDRLYFSIPVGYLDNNENQESSSSLDTSETRHIFSRPGQRRNNPLPGSGPALRVGPLRNPTHINPYSDGFGQAFDEDEGRSGIDQEGYGILANVLSHLQEVAETEGEAKKKNIYEHYYYDDEDEEGNTEADEEESSEYYYYDDDESEYYYVDSEEYRAASNEILQSSPAHSTTTKPSVFSTKPPEIKRITLNLPEIFSRAKEEESPPAVFKQVIRYQPRQGPTFPPPPVRKDLPVKPQPRPAGNRNKPTKEKKKDKNKHKKRRNKGPKNSKRRKYILHPSQPDYEEDFNRVKSAVKPFYGSSQKKKQSNNGTTEIVAEATDKIDTAETLGFRYAFLLGVIPAVLSTLLLLGHNPFQSLIVGAYIVTVYFVTFEGVSGFDDRDEATERSWIDTLTQFMDDNIGEDERLLGSSELTYVEVLKALDRGPLASFLNEDSMKVLYKVFTYLDERRKA